MLTVCTFICYSPSLNGHFVWDDDAWTLHLENLLQDLSGLRVIWTDLTALQQFYPVTATTFWLDYHFWSFHTLPYHVENLVFHLLAAFLFWKLLKRLEVPGAWLASAVFALHPMMVESVAWITERKNVVSLVFFLGALLCYAEFTSDWHVQEDPPGAQIKNDRKRWWSYICTLILFLAAYLAKATAFAFPAVVLLICWWKRGRLRLLADIGPALPLLLLGIGLGAVTSWLERTHVGACGPDWDLSLLERCIIAGRALWFYVGKLLWPAKLCFIYPRWHVNPHSIWQWVPMLLAALILIVLWVSRK